MIAIKICVDSEKRDVLRLNGKEALRVSQILLEHANELKSRGDLKAAMLGSFLKEYATKKLESKNISR